MKSKIVFLVCIMFFIVACEKEQIPLEKPIEAPAPSSNDEKPEEKPEGTTEGQPEEKPEQQPEIQATLEKLSIAQLPHKTFYTLGEELNLNGLQLTGLYSDGKEYPVTVFRELAEKAHEKRELIRVAQGAHAFLLSVGNKQPDVFGKIHA